MTARGDFPSAWLRETAQVDGLSDTPGVLTAWMFGDTGPVTITGTGAVTIAAPAVSGTGSVSGVSVTGTGAVTIAAPAVSGTGSVSGVSVTGTAAVAIAAPAVAASGSEAITGTASIGLAAPTLAATGAEDIAGTAGLVLTSPSVTGTGNAITSGVTGTVALAIAAPAVAATGVQTGVPVPVPAAGGRSRHAPSWDRTTPPAAVSGVGAIAIGRAHVTGSGTTFDQLEEDWLLGRISDEAYLLRLTEDEALLFGFAA